MSTLRHSSACSRLGALSLLTLLLFACGGKDQGAGGPGGPGGAMPPPQVTVVTLRAEPLTLTRELPGRTSPVLVAEVRPQVSGIVKTRSFSEGGMVRAGQTLYQLDDAVYRAELANAEAALAKAQAALEAARLASKRAGELRAIDAVSEQERENAVAAERSGEADVAAAKARVARARLDLQYSRIASPITGRVGMSAVTPGALVTANQAEPLATVQQLDPIYVDLTQSSAAWLQLQREIAAGNMQAGGNGMPVSIVLEDGTRYAQQGQLKAADVTVDEATGSFALRVVVPNPDGVLRPGMYVTAVLPEATVAQAVLAPQQGVTRDAKGDATALVVGADGKVELRPVKVSRTIGDRWLVEDGLHAGDRVIVEGVQKVQPGMAVQAVEAGAAPAAAGAGATGAEAPAPGAGH